MRSITGMVAYIHGVGPIYSRSSLQTTISRSTAEAEYKAASTAAQFCSSFRQLLEEIGFPQTSPTTIHGDNQACLAIAGSKISGSNTRHIKLQYHYIRELILNKEVEMIYCPTEKMIADIMTKALAPAQFTYLKDILLNGM
jgi:KUP system potassium uptake protein